MSYTKVTWWRPATAAALLALAAVAVWLAIAGSSARAGGDGSVFIDPALAEVGPGGTTTVDVVVTPPDTTLSIWIIEIEYDPAVVQVADDGGNPDCDSLNIPGGVAGAAGCATKDTGGGPEDDTAVAFGGWVENVGGEAVGFDTEMTVASFTFEAVGDIGESSPLTVSVTAFLDPAGEEPVPAEADGQINIIEIVGDQRTWPDTNCDTNLNIGDAINVARKQVNLPVTTNGCPTLGVDVTADGTPRKYGDTNCDNLVNIGDAINIARKQVNLPVDTHGCPTLGSQVIIVVV